MKTKIHSEGGSFGRFAEMTVSYLTRSSDGFGTFIKGTMVILVSLLVFSGFGQGTVVQLGPVGPNSDGISMLNAGSDHFGSGHEAILNTIAYDANVAKNISNLAMAPVKLSIEQVRNGSGASPTNPVQWQNGNAGASNAHYVEGWSIPYRVIISNLPANGQQSVDIEWDIRHSSKNAIDFITDYDLIDYLPGSHASNFNHLQETIDPTSGYNGMVGPTKVQIPTPSLPPMPLGSFNDISGIGKGMMSIWNGTILSMEYISQGNLGNAASSTRLRIHFTNTTGTVIISWAGHIAKATDWGDGNSASAVSGSPYHSRVLQWDPGDDGIDPVSLGNQDRSLSAAAVIDPPPCEVAGPDLVCPGSTGNVYQNNAAADPNVIPSGFTYQWSVTGNASISGSTTGAKVSVDAGADCEASYTVKLEIRTSNGVFITSCSKDVTTQDILPPTFNMEPAEILDIKCDQPLPIQEILTATDNCSTITVVPTVDDYTEDICNGYDVTYRWTATDDCGNKAEKEVTFKVLPDTDAPTFDNEPSPISDIKCDDDLPAQEELTASDDCSTLTVVPSVDPYTVDICAGYEVTYRWTATDNCNNSDFRTVTFKVLPDTAPPIITSCPADVFLQCDGDSTDPGATGSPTATDDCSEIIYTPSDDFNSVGCRTIITRTWTVEDACGNSSSCVQRIVISDTTAPEFGSCPTNDGPPSVTDNCSGVTLFSSDAGDTRTWTAIDESGNISTLLCEIVIAPVVQTLSKSVSSSSIKAYPNPFNDTVNFQIDVEEKSKGTLVLYNMLGQKVKTVFDADLKQGANKFDAKLPYLQNMTLIYVLQIGEERITGKLIKMDR